jgi:hypothetical protein
MKVEVVTVCVGYADFLAATLPENLPVIDDMIVVTDPSDEETRAVCRKHNVRHVLSEDHKRGGPFNKARLINRGFDQLSANEWILHLDADVVLPRQFKQMLGWADLDERCIYGCDRQSIVGWDEWKAFKQYVDRWDNHTHELGYWWHPNYKPMSRLVSSLHGYTPIGFFQLFHGSELIQHNMHVRQYPTSHQDAARTDHQFSLQWDRRYRQLLPEVIVLHLESEKGTHGANWCGRTTKRFGPEPKAQDNARWLGAKSPADSRGPHHGPRHHHDHHHHHDRHHHHHHDHDHPSC